MLDILLAGDLNPTLRSELPGAMRSAIRDDNRPLLRLLLRAKGLTGIPDARKQGALDEADSDALFAATRCEESAFPWDRAAGPEQRADPGGGRRPGAPGHRLPALQLQGRAAQRVDPRVRGVARTPARRPAPPTPAAAGAHADPVGRLRPAHAASRTPPASPRGSRAPQLVAVPFTGHSVVTSDLSDCAKNAIAAFFAGQPAAQCPNAQQVIAPSPIAPTRLSRLPGRTKARKTVAAVTATVRDVRLQFLGDEIAAGRDDAGRRQGRAACAPGTRPRPRAATTCAASSSSPASSVNGFVPSQPGTTTLTISGRSAPHGKLTFHPDGPSRARWAGARCRRRPPARRSAVSRPLPVKLPRYRRLLQLG